MARFWQGLVGVIAAIALVSLAIIVIHFRDAGGTFGLDGSSDRTQPGVFHVTAVKPPASGAGVRAGDTLRYDPSPANVLKLSSTAPGDRIVFHDGTRDVVLTATAASKLSTTNVAFLITFLLAKLAFVAMAILIIWRKADDPAARALAVFLVAFGAAIDFDPVIFRALPLRAAALLLNQIFVALTAVGVYAFSCYFPQTADRGFRQWMRRLLPALTVVIAAVALGAVVVDYARGGVGSGLGSTYVLLYLATVGAAIVSLMLSYRNASAGERARMRWVLGTFAVGLSGIVLLLLAAIVGVNPNDAQPLALTIITIPFGLAYVILRHRVLDITFVVNRALVYSIVSVIVVGAFIIFEWLLSHLVESNSRTSVLLQLGGALALGLSVRFVHARVDAHVDDFFFRDRHLAEEAIRRFAQEAALITDADVLVKRTVEVAQRNARLTGAAFYARRNGLYLALYSTLPNATALDENDEAVLAMRTWHNPVHGQAFMDSRLCGDDAFPMMVRGQLAGFLACGTKLSHESLAPDERDALRVLARDAGIALDSLRIARIEAELAFLSADGELPPAVRLRLSSLVAPQDRAQPAGPPVRSSQ